MALNAPRGRTTDARRSPLFTRPGLERLEDRTVLEGSPRLLQSILRVPAIVAGYYARFADAMRETPGLEFTSSQPGDNMAMAAERGPMPLLGHGAVTGEN